jgi:hypothetical protein
MKVIYRFLTIITLLIPVRGFTDVPNQVNFQGLLVDSVGQQITGSVNFDFAIFDALVSGTQLWTESQTGITVTNGRYTVALGSVSPLTTSILDSGSVYLEITVNGETLTPRERLLAVPYALRAQEAENVGGISNVFIQQIFQHANFDGGLPANDDPLEGLVDTDGDGLANFIDSDNDNDGIADGIEVTNGTGVNLSTPTISAVVGPLSGDPSKGITGEPNLFTVTGNAFLAGLTVQVGPENPAPQNLTSSSFEITVGVGQTGGNGEDVIVTNPNAEVGTGGPINFQGVDKRVFVTSGSIANAHTQTTAAADAFCNTAASNAGLTGSYVAWYSDPSNSMSAKDRVPEFHIWNRLDGATVAEFRSDLTDGTIDNPINVDEFGTTIVGQNVATNTLTSGDFDPNSCFGSSPTTGYLGRSDSATGTWTESHKLNCANAQKYYCFEI